MSQTRQTPASQLERTQHRPAKQAAISAPRQLVSSLKEGVSRCVSAPLQHICGPSLAPWCCFNVFLYAWCSAHCLSFLFFNAGLSGFHPSMWKGLFVLHWVRLAGKWMNRREHLEPRRWKAPYTKHKRAFLLISVFRRQKKTHFLKCSLEIFCFEVVKEFRMWDKGETLAWSEDNSLFLRGLGLNCRECWHAARAQLPRPQHLLKKVELEACALHSLLIIALPASTIVHVLWHSQSPHLGFAQDSVDKPNDECGKLLPERVWLGLRLKSLAKDSPVVFLFIYAQHRGSPILQKAAQCEAEMLCLQVTHYRVDSAYRWIMSALVLTWHNSRSVPRAVPTLSPYLLLVCFFSSKDLLADVWSLALFEPETLCKSLTKSSPLSLRALLTDTRCFTCLTLNTHVLTADGWVGIFMYSKAAQSRRLARSVNQKLLRGPFCVLTESVKTCVCLHPFIMAWYVQKCCSSLTLSSVKGWDLHAVFAAAFLGLPG